jgi:hypothetical protein
MFFVVLALTFRGMFQCESQEPWTEFNPWPFLIETLPFSHGTSRMTSVALCSGFSLWNGSGDFTRLEERMVTAGC